MGKRKTMILTFFIILIVLSGSVYILHNVLIKDASKDTVKKDTTGESTGSAEEEASAADIKTEEILYSENINVINNSPEYDLKAMLCENSSNEISIKLDYYKDGASVLKELGVGQIPEISRVFNGRNKESENRQVNGIKAFYLNPQLSKVYFFVENSYNQDTTDMVLYSYDLEDSAIKKLYGEREAAKVSGLLLTGDGVYAGFSYSKSEPLYNSYLNILNCESDEMIVSENTGKNGLPLGVSSPGTAKDAGTIKYYELMSWHTNSIAKVKEFTRNPDNSAPAPVPDADRELLYDLEKNILLNMDGSTIIYSNEPQNQGSEQQNVNTPQAKTETESVETLKSFYTYLATEQYGKATELLNDEFKIKLNIFKQFGIDEVGKQDIDLNEAAVYGSIFKTAKIESIIDEKVSDNVSTVYYFQTVSLNENGQVRIPLVATMKKDDKGWKLTLVIDGNTDEKPFKL